ncbi:M48 family metalloprotease [Catenovulum sp. SM1970]|uniref:M48 family metalloprotease n=1 Tax=Marinifaba aquimaris TaxID=2741323 RepID=UPI0015731D20|nr:M48 family metalloprotease [Marinifaba aquimaris]
MNALATGYYDHSAAICITRGAIEKLERDELQAIVSHELGHIINGDNRLNVLMASVLYGISFPGIWAEYILNSAVFSRNKSYSFIFSSQVLSVFAFFIGIFLILFCWIGTVFADLIKSAVCRQREFLADACSVQYTRNSESLIRVFRLIAGQQTKTFSNTTSAHFYSHFFFDRAVNPWLNIFPTHPSLIKRAKKVDPYFVGKLIELERSVGQSYLATSYMVNRQVVRNVHRPVFDQVRTQTNSTMSFERVVEGISSELVHIAHEPHDARILIYCLLLNENCDVRLNQLKQLKLCLSKDEFIQLDRIESQVSGLKVKQQFNLIEMVIPVLHTTSSRQQKNISDTLGALIKVDSNEPEFNNLLHWAIFELLYQHLNLEYKLNLKLSRADAIQLLLNTLSSVGHSDEISAEIAFENACQILKEEALSYQFTKLDFRELSSALAAVSNLPKRRKFLLLKAFKTCIEQDNSVTENEKNLLLVFKLRLDLPEVPF